jgi:hypothetical protein
MVMAAPMPKIAAKTRDKAGSSEWFPQPSEQPELLDRTPEEE